MARKPIPPALNPTPDMSPQTGDSTAAWKRIELNVSDILQRLTALENGGGSGSNEPYPGPMAPVEATGSPGVSPDFARGDHAHQGVQSLAADGAPPLYGALTLAADPGATIREAGNTIFVGAGGGGGANNCPLYEVRTTTGDTDLSPCDCILLCDCSQQGITVTLPTSADGLFYAVKKVDTSLNAVTLLPQTGELIDFSFGLTWTGGMESFAVVGDGAGGWWIVWWYNSMPNSANTPNVTITGANGQQPAVTTQGGVSALATTDTINRRLLEAILLEMQAIRKALEEKA